MSSLEEEAEYRKLRRAEMLRGYHSANGQARIWLLFQLVSILGLSLYMEWRTLLLHPWVTVIALGMLVGPHLTPLVILWAKPKKEIGNLKETTKFGEFDKHNLRQLFRLTAEKLMLPHRDLPVFITADKSVSAANVRLGLLGAMRGMNGVYLNRQVLHRMTPDEVQVLMGHELGHYHKYSSLHDRFGALSSLVGALLGFVMGQASQIGPGGSVMLSVGCAFLVQKFDNFYWRNKGNHNYFLCDDYAAQVHGVGKCVDVLIKLGVDAELQIAIQQQAALAGNIANVSKQGILQAVERELPYGHTSVEEMVGAIERAIKVQTQKENQKSLVGFLDYMWNSGSQEYEEAEVEQTMMLYKQLDALPRVDWERCLDDPTEIQFDELSLGKLSECLVEEPGLLFRIPGEAGWQVGEEPTLKERVIYLLLNRKEIEHAFRAGDLRYRN